MIAGLPYLNGGIGLTVHASRITPRLPVPDFFVKIGAGEGIRTLDPNLGKVVLYP